MKITTFSEPKELVKEGLLFYSSNPNEPLVDSKGNAHTVTVEDIQALANNTNEYLKYTDIYVFPDHDRDPAKAYGLISNPGSFEAKEITEDIATKHPKLKPLIGRWGLFCNNVKLIEESIVDKVSKGLSKSVSVGADLINKVIKELSITSTPACAGASLFNNKSNITNFNMETQETTAVTLEEALADDGEQERVEAEAMQLLDTFLDVVNNIAAMSDEELGNYQVASKEELYQAQLESFMMMLDEKINPFAGMMDQQQAQVDPRMQQQMQRQPAQYSYPLAITTFDEMDQYISEYGFGSTIKAGLGAIKTGIKSKLGASGVSAVKTGLNKAKSALGGGLLKTKTALANTAQKGLGAAGSIGTKLSGSKTGLVSKIGKSIANKTNNAAMGLANRRLGRYSSSSKLSRFVK